MSELIKLLKEELGIRVIKVEMVIYLHFIFYVINKIISYIISGIEKQALGRPIFYLKERYQMTEKKARIKLARILRRHCKINFIHSQRIAKLLLGNGTLTEEEILEFLVNSGYDIEVKYTDSVLGPQLDEILVSSKDGQFLGVIGDAFFKERSQLERQL